jgi:uncharacterized membrane protein
MSVPDLRTVITFLELADLTLTGTSVISWAGAGDGRLMADDDSDDLESDTRAAERLTFFTDAVIAIAMTLLAIDLPIPEGHTVSEFWKSVQDNDGHYAAFLISFYVIAAAWSGHHDIFRYVRRVDTRVRTLNTSWLLMIVITPFATRLLTAEGETLDTHALRWGFYALVQLLDSAIMLAMLRHLVTHRQLAGLKPRVLTAMTWRNLSPALAFGLSIPVFFITSFGWVTWFVVPAALARLHRLPPPKPGGSRDPGDPGRPADPAGAGQPGSAA